MEKVIYGLRGGIVGLRLHGIEKIRPFKQHREPAQPHFPHHFFFGVVVIIFKIIILTVFIHVVRLALDAELAEHLSLVAVKKGKQFYRLFGIPAIFGNERFQISVHRPGRQHRLVVFVVADRSHFHPFGAAPNRLLQTHITVGPIDIGDECAARRQHRMLVEPP